MFEQSLVPSHVASTTPSPSMVGNKLFDSVLVGDEDMVRELLKAATAEEVNWQAEVSCAVDLFCFWSVYRSK